MALRTGRWQEAKCILLSAFVTAALSESNRQPAGTLGEQSRTDMTREKFGEASLKQQILFSFYLSWLTKRKKEPIKDTQPASLSLFHCQICCLVWGLETNDFLFFLLNELSYLGMDDGFRRYRVGYEHALLLPCGTPVLLYLQTLTQLLSQHLDTNSL